MAVLSPIWWNHKGQEAFPIGSFGSLFDIILETMHNEQNIHFCKINKALKIVCKTKEYWINVPIDKLIAHKYFYI